MDSWTPDGSVFAIPCAVCKILRRKCGEKCVLAPYFPPYEPLKFATAHRVFGASNIIKLLQGLPECQRADAVSSLVYDANMRIRDPVYGCAGVICQLQKQVSDLQVQLAMSQAELVQSQQGMISSEQCYLNSAKNGDHKSLQELDLEDKNGFSWLEPWPSNTII